MESNTIDQSQHITPTLETKNIEKPTYDISFSSFEDLSQGEEFFYLNINGSLKKIMIHDYKELYSYPFLYEQVLYDLLKCNTPNAICEILQQEILKTELTPSDINCLEIGAGSGIFAEHLSNIGITNISGLDIFDLAKEAAQRDRPGLYSDYYAVDLTNLTDIEEHELIDKKFNCVAVASATGWGNHIPVNGFEKAFQLLEKNGIFVFHVKDDDNDPECVNLYSWFNGLIADNRIELKEKKSCFHRVSINGKEIYYDVCIGIKK